MSVLQKVEFTDSGVSVTLRLSKEEYGLLHPEANDFLLIPTNKLRRILVTGRIGNGNRIMVPSKFLKAHGIQAMKKNVRSTIFTIEKKKVLVIELEKGRTGIPSFEGEEYASQERPQET